MITEKEWKEIHDFFRTFFRTWGFNQHSLKNSLMLAKEKGLVKKNALEELREYYNLIYSRIETDYLNIPATSFKHLYKLALKAIEELKDE